MKKEAKEIEKIYVVRDIAPDGSKYISQILIESMEYNNKKVEYFSLSPSKLKGSSKRQEKAQAKMNEHLKKIVRDLDASDFKKLVFISDYDQNLRNYVDHEIQMKKAKDCKKIETFQQVLTTVETVANLSMILSPLHGSLNVFFGGVTASSASLATMKTNQDRKKFPQLGSEWIRKARFGFSMALLGLNATLGITNFSLALDEMKQDYTIEKEKDDILKQRKLIIDDLDNPFESDIMFTSADATTNILMEAFELNPLIEEEDRKIATNLRQYLLENPYLDYGKLYDDFSSFGIIDTNASYGNVAATSGNDYITVYLRDSMTKEQYANHLGHELVHRTGHLNCPMLNEGMTSLIHHEYMSNFQYTSAYYDEILMTKIFCELITPDKMLEAYSKDDMRIIKNELLKLNSNEDKYREFISLLNSYSVERNGYVNRGTLSSFYNEGKALDYQDKFAMMVMDYMYNANFDDAKVSRITEYLKGIGYGKHLTSNQTVYFNKNAKELSYENAYSSDLEETSSYHY